MEVEYQRLVDEMERMEKVLGNVQKRDSYTYRSLFGLDPIDNNVWRGGIGGHNEYENFEQYKRVGETIVETQKRLRRLKHSLVIQSKSLDTIMNYAKKEEKFLASRPSIKPVRSDKLAKGVNFLSGFGYRIHPIFKVKKMHYGIDFTAPKGTAIQATGSGRVVKATRNAGFGNHIVIDHGFGYQTIYAHLSKINIRQGDQVVRGQLIGTVGSSGISTAPHCHYEVHVNGKPVNPISYCLDGLSVQEYKELVTLAGQVVQSLD
jgi:murein DD-endopeptidase MepM/ murein hydrolase activator NlpD